MANDRISDFLAAVDDLRGDDETVRTTAHTSSVSAEGWPTTEAPATTEAPPPLTQSDRRAPHR